MMKKLAKRGNMNERIDTVMNRFRSRMSSYPPGMCPISLYRALLQVSMNQSCGKCVPCREGLAEVDHMLGSIIKGRGDEETLSRLGSLCQMIKESSDCAVGISAAQLILESLSEFSDEYESHIKNHRCLLDVRQTVPCITLCPAHVNVPGYIALINKGESDKAIQMIREKNPFPTACAMVCEHPCEKKCRRRLIDDAINIRGLKKYAVDTFSADKVPNVKCNVSTGKRVAVVGAGPSGLTAAYYLALMGHSVTIYEEHEKSGGMLRYGIPEYRLPKKALDIDINMILSMDSIEVKYSTKVGRDITLQKLRDEFDAVYLALGAQIGNKMPVDGADSKNVVPAADFLQMVAAGKAPDLSGKRVALIGGGNVAMDAARTAVRLHAETVHVFTRKRDDYTALQEEIIGAMQEGVRFRTLLSFLNIEADSETNEVKAVWLQPEMISRYDEFGMMTTEHSSRYPYRFVCDYLILAVGQRSDLKDFESEGLPVNRGRILTDEECFVEGMDKVFSGGDCVSGPSTAINAIAAGQVAAYNIDEYLGYHHKISSEVEVPAAYPNPCIPTGRTEIEEKDPYERKSSFDFIEEPMTEEEAVLESGRCLRCDHYGCGAMKGGLGDE